MELNDLIAALTEGLTTDQAAIVKAAIERDAVKAKAAGWKNQTEADALNARAVALQAELEGGPQELGARAVKDWYVKSAAALTQLQTDHKAYVDKYGPLTAPTTTTPPAQNMSTGLTKEEAQRIFDDNQKTYNSRVSNVVLTTGKLMQRHLRNKRETDIDFAALADAANAKFGGDLERAYEEWDKPEQEKQAKANQKAEVDRLVKEELQKRGARTNFPSVEENSGAMASRTKAEASGFDKVALQNELAQTFMSAGEDTVQ